MLRSQQAFTGRASRTLLWCKAPCIGWCFTEVPGLLRRTAKGHGLWQPPTLECGWKGTDCLRMIVYISPTHTSRGKPACLLVADEMVPVVEQVTSHRAKEKVSPLVFQTRPHFSISTLPSLSVSLSTCPSISIPAARQRANSICYWDLHTWCFTQLAIKCQLELAECPLLIRHYILYL